MHPVAAVYDRRTQKKQASLAIKNRKTYSSPFHHYMKNEKRAYCLLLVILFLFGLYDLNQLNAWKYRFSKNEAFLASIQGQATPEAIDQVRKLLNIPGDVISTCLWVNGVLLVAASLYLGFLGYSLTKKMTP